MTRSLTDAVIMLSIIAGKDPLHAGAACRRPRLHDGIERRLPARRAHWRPAPRVPERQHLRE